MADGRRDKPSKARARVLAALDRLRARGERADARALAAESGVPYRRILHHACQMRKGGLPVEAVGHEERSRRGGETTRRRGALAAAATRERVRLAAAGVAGRGLPVTAAGVAAELAIHQNTASHYLAALRRDGLAPGPDPRAYAPAAKAALSRSNRDRVVRALPKLSGAPKAREVAAVTGMHPVTAARHMAAIRESGADEVGYTPTAAEIRAACAAIQREWSPAAEDTHRAPAYRRREPTFGGRLLGAGGFYHAELAGEKSW